ncbi:hypothetical protein V2A60_001858 [Cordyceps javanica]
MLPRFRILAATVALLACPLLLHALTVPDDLPDGVYEIDWAPGTKGQIASWTYFDIPHDVNITAIKFNGVVPLPVGGHDVDCLLDDRRLENITLSDFTRADDQTKAMAMLGNWCEMATYLHKDAMAFALYNDMIWYVCNWDNMHNFFSNIQRCSKLEIHEAAAWMDRRCGADKRAELSIGYWQKTYGRSQRFGDICNFKDLWSGN